ncbi:MAG TPA: DivIVA domain-containing protein [Solirubrobacteraceae bacterium]|nr:DivIVA domain-containing protein [Solirubrobacteraceae bacterium]
MPDQSSASSEHAIMQEITAPLATLPDDPVPAVADVEFPSALRGYDRLAVDAYVQKTSQLVAELQATRSPEAAVRRALERVGEEVSGILQRAHETAGNITAQSRSEAEDRLETARQEATQIIQRAEDRVRELDAETDRIWAERHRIVEDTRELAGQLLTLTDSAADRFPPDPASAETTDVAPSDELAPEDEEEFGAVEEGVTPEEDPRAEPAPVQVPDEDALPDEVPVDDDDRDPDIESTAVLPVIEPPEDDTETT